MEFEGLLTFIVFSLIFTILLNNSILGWIFTPIKSFWTDAFFAFSVTEVAGSALSLFDSDCESMSNLKVAEKLFFLSFGLVCLLQVIAAFQSYGIEVRHDQNTFVKMALVYAVFVGFPLLLFITQSGQLRFEANLTVFDRFSTTAESLFSKIFFGANLTEEVSNMSKHYLQYKFETERQYHFIQGTFVVEKLEGKMNEYFHYWKLDGMHQFEGATWNVAVNTIIDVLFRSISLKNDPDVTTNAFLTNHPACATKFLLSVSFIRFSLICVFLYALLVKKTK